MGKLLGETHDGALVVSYSRLVSERFARGPSAHKPQGKSLLGQCDAHFEEAIAG